jgi:hypothetical protein
MNVRLAVAVAALVTIQGCATMDQEECLASDWHAIGFEDGARGYPVDRIGQHRKACADHGIAPDLAAYRQGRDEGLRHYCTAQNGFNLGAKGSNYAGGCPEDLAADFAMAYGEGRRLHDLSHRVRGVDHRIAATERQVADLEKQIDVNEQTIIASDTNNFERARLLLEIKELVDQREDLEDQLEHLQQERIVYQRELEDYRETVAYIER